MSANESDIKTWLDTVFEKENIEILSFDVKGHTEQGDNFLSNVKFVNAEGRSTDDDSAINYDLIVKYSKKKQSSATSSEAASKTESETDPRFRETFVNEIFCYGTLFPALRDFVNSKEDVKQNNIFIMNIPKCFGTILSDDIQVIVLEDLKPAGFEMWPRKVPHTRDHIDLIIDFYAKFHATSAAMEFENSEGFADLVTELQNNLFRLAKSGPEVTPLFSNVIKEIGILLEDSVDARILNKWKSLSDQVGSILIENDKAKTLNVLLHGDCWNNNFMFKYAFENNRTKPSQVMTVDWQMTRYASIICDLSCFIFACISEQDIGSLDSILFEYYSKFSSYSFALGLDKIYAVYPMRRFLNEWKKYCKYGIILSSYLLKISLADKEDVVDLGESGKTFTENLVGQVRDTESFKKRMKYIVEFVVKRGYIGTSQKL